MNLVACTHAKHAQAVLEILNEAIENSTAIYEYKPRPFSSMAGWFETKAAGGFPVIGIESDDQQLQGFATFGVFRAWPAYKYTVEHSIYVHRDFRGQGLGRALLQELIATAQSQDRHVLIGGIDSENRTSIALHEKLGFGHAGTIRQAGYKFGRWLDLAFYQLTLATPSAPRAD